MVWSIVYFSCGINFSKNERELEMLSSQLSKKWKSVLGVQIPVVPTEN